MGTQDMVRVDPKLFVTCRLCLEEMGTYQITPLVREQFLYCFNIEVEAFDGMPQLICEECQTVLSDYSTKKRIYIGRQNALKAQLQVRREIQLQAQKDLVKSSTNENEDKETISNGTEAPTTRLGGRRRISRPESSTGSSSGRWSKSPSPSLNCSKTTNNRKKDQSSQNYRKSIICRFCNKQLKTRASLKNHLKHKHVAIQSTFSNILSRPCSIKLDKFDEVLNKSGIPNTVMIDQTKIISQTGCNTHYIKYIPNKIDQQPTAENSGTDSDQEVIGKGNQAKRRRLLSTDTVVLNNENKSPTVPSAETKPVASKDIECIDLDDSSDESSLTGVPNHDDDNGDANHNDDADHNMKDENFDSKAMQSLVTMCYNRYTKKCESQPKVDPGVLKHKILSIGRKIISKERESSFTFTGLLRYMESKNLEIRWVPPRNPKVDKNVVRIMTMLKEKDVIAENKLWKKISIREKKNKRQSPPANIAPAKNKENNNLAEVTQENNTHNGNVSPFVTDTTLYMEPDKILLNENPVANPKQMPKKSTLPVISLTSSLADLLQAESKPPIKPVTVTHAKKSTTGMPVITSTSSLANIVQTENKQHVIPATSTLAILVQQKGNNQAGSLMPDTSATCLKPLDNVNVTPSGNELCMPVITSTTSLAPENRADTFDNSMNNEVEDSQQQPRIKVKPASQLMSDRALQSLNDHQVQNQNIMPSGSMVQLPAPTINFVTLGNSDATDSDNNRIILHTVEFPNTITASPFRYFRNLLQVHNLILLDPNTAITSAFICLIKFKLQFLWDSVNEPVTLCLTVHCLGNTYILGVKDPNQINNIDINKLSAIWQWQILKIYVTREDVVNKMLLTAQKVSVEVHNNTKRFLCLLKSINYKLPSHV